VAAARERAAEALIADRTCSYDPLRQLQHILRFHAQMFAHQVAAFQAALPEEGIRAVVFL